ncbi:CYTH-like domain-containing protein [Chiua virens]|nr:CYTH-like domain-containing protein [Chiua virens]
MSLECPLLWYVFEWAWRNSLIDESQEKQLSILSNLSTGLLIGTALGVILPEGIEELVASAAGNQTSYSFSIGPPILLGFTWMFLLEEHVISHGLGQPPEAQIFDVDLEEHGRQSNIENPPLRHAETSGLKRAYPLSFGLIIHALVDGYALGVSASNTHSPNLSLIVFLAIIVHKAPTALALTTALLASSLSVTDCKKHLLYFSLATPASSLLSYVIYSFTSGSGNPSAWSGGALLFSGGTFLYVASVVQPISGHGSESVVRVYPLTMSSPGTDSESEREATPPQKRPRPSGSPRTSGSASTNVKHNSIPPTTSSTSTPPIMNNPNLPPLSVSILGVEPLDEFIKEIADFVHHMVTTRPTNVGTDAKVEVEAKLGILKDRTTGKRITLPVLVETILHPEAALDLRFESNMSAVQHKHFNTLLNELQRNSSEPSHPASPLEYKHFKLVDSFYPSGDARDREKIRVTREEQTGNVVEITKKKRLGDLNVYCPKRSADWRVSVSLEIPVSHPVGTPTLTRRKDRICYSHEEFNIDLTQVVSNAGPNSPPEILHELEVEIARPALLLSTACKRVDPNVPEHERNAFDELIRSFVNNARILVKNASEGWS